MGIAGLGKRALNALAYMRRYITFNEQSPIFGKWDDSKYRFLIKPALALDDIRCKKQVVYKASSAMGTVFLQGASAYRLDRMRKSMLLVAQSDDDSEEWAKTRIRPFLERIKTLKESVKDDKYAITNSMWQWANHYAIITGPGLNAQQSKQVCYVHTDESHLYRAGTLAAFDDRMGGRWDRASLHVTTAADEGHEIDILYHSGNQNEWHLACIHCHKLIWPLWRWNVKEVYGKPIFVWNEDGGDNSILESLKMICPHCDKELFDDTRTRTEMSEGADYVAMNPDAPAEVQSFRWNCFAVTWRTWRERLETYLSAIKSARLGDLKPYENWCKKHETISYVPEMPELNKIGTGGFEAGEIWITQEDRQRYGGIDVQDKGGLHFWALCCEYNKKGDSRRINYSRLETWEKIREWQLYYNIPDVPSPNPNRNQPQLGCDYGHRYVEVFAKCAMWKWLALKSGDDEEPMEFTHFITDPVSKQRVSVIKPYSMVQMQDGSSGKAGEKVKATRGIPEGFCASRIWSKSAIGFILLRLLSGESGREYGIPNDFSPDFMAQINSYIKVSEPMKRNSLVMHDRLRKIRTQDHAFACASENLLLAIINGFFPMDFQTVKQNQLVTI